MTRNRGPHRMIRHCLVFAGVILFAISSLVKAEEVSPQPIETFPVILEPLEKSKITAEVFLKVIEIPKRLGEPFHKGDLLIKFDNAALYANLAKAERGLKKAEADLAVKQALSQDRLISNLELKESEANFSTAQSEVVIAKKNLEMSEIRAPYDGKVADLTVHLFEVPQRERPMMEIVNDNTLVANFLIPSNYLKNVHIGAPVYILIKDTGEIVQATVARISPVVNPASSTVKVEAEIDNSTGHLKTGMASIASFSKGALTQQENPLKEILEEIKSQSK